MSFSTVEAQQRMIEAGKSASKRKKSIDAAAACVILEHFLLSRKIKRNSFFSRLQHYSVSFIFILIQFHFDSISKI